MIQRRVEHRAVPVSDELGDLQPQIVNDHGRAPCPEVGDSGFEGGDTGVAGGVDLLNADGLQINEALLH